ncbi:hypothetical protein D3C86_720770 [compost metagenome]
MAPHTSRPFLQTKSSQNHQLPHHTDLASCDFGHGSIPLYKHIYHPGSRQYWLNIAQLALQFSNKLRFWFPHCKPQLLHDDFYHQP